MMMKINQNTGRHEQTTVFHVVLIIKTSAPKMPEKQHGMSNDIQVENASFTLHLPIDHQPISDNKPPSLVNTTWHCPFPITHRTPTHAAATDPSPLD